MAGSARHVEGVSAEIVVAISNREMVGDYRIAVKAPTGLKAAAAGRVLVTVNEVDSPVASIVIGEPQAESLVCRHLEAVVHRAAVPDHDREVAGPARRPHGQAGIGAVVVLGDQIAVIVVDVDVQVGVAIAFQQHGGALAGDEKDRPEFEAPVGGHGRVCLDRSPCHAGLGEWADGGHSESGRKNEANDSVGHLIGILPDLAICFALTLACAYTLSAPPTGMTAQKISASGSCRDCDGGLGSLLHQQPPRGRIHAEAGKKLRS